MACLCAEFSGASRKRPNVTINNTSTGFKTGNDIQNVEVCASELAAAEAEIWILKRNIKDAKKSLQELKIMKEELEEMNEKQMLEIRKVQLENAELRDDLHRLRDSHTVEKNALLRQLHELRTAVIAQGHNYEKLCRRNKDLTLELRDAHEKIYVVGMKFLKLKAAASIHSSKTPSMAGSSDNDSIDSN